MKIACLVICFFLASGAEAKKIALTFDDAPRANTPLLGARRSSLLLENLQNAGVGPVVFFVNTERMLSKENRERVEAYAGAGHLVANHTHSHPDLNATSPESYADNISRAHAVLSHMPGFTGFFRFPYLREGNTLTKRDAIRNHLAVLGLRNGYVTVNNYDWALDQQVQDALRAGKRLDSEKLRELYVNVLLEDVAFYDGMAMETTGRSPSHVLLLHENDLAALYVGDLIKALRNRGWSVIPATEAWRDPISEYEDPELWPHNPGRVGELAGRSGRWGRKQLWSPNCDEETIAARLRKSGVFR